MTNYQKVCPKCGAMLSPVALDPQTAPWHCAGCARGFWTHELTASLRELYRVRHDDFGLGVERIAIHAAIAEEVAQARERGTSLREDQVVHTPLSTLEHLSTRAGLHVDFKSLIDNHLTSTGDNQ